MMDTTISRTGLVSVRRGITDHSPPPVAAVQGHREPGLATGLGHDAILGGGNVGKTTLLDAVALLLHTTNGYTLSNADYWQRNVGAGFIAVKKLTKAKHFEQQWWAEGASP